MSCMFDFPGYPTLPPPSCTLDYPECLGVLASLRSAEFAFRHQREGGKQKEEKRTKQIMRSECVCVGVGGHVCLCMQENWGRERKTYLTC